MPEPGIQGADGSVAARIAAMLGPTDWTQAEEMLQSLPPGIPILPPEEAGNFAKYRNKPDRVYAKDEAWQKCAALMETHAAELCKAHREEIDTLLVFAGLFSAVVTGFTVESYQWLQDDPNDAIVSLLSQISQSVATNGTVMTTAQSSSGMARSVSVRINAYWFVSLTLSLATALLAILGKQWVREYERHTPMPPSDYVGVRQVKFEGILYWKVGDIISSLPLLLQLSLALFAVGVLEFLWHLDIVVCIAVCVPIALTWLFYLATTLLPLCHFVYHRPPRTRTSYIPPCAFKSPQAILAMHTYTSLATAWWGLADAVSFVYRWLSRRICACLRKHGILAGDMNESIFHRRHNLNHWQSWAFWDKSFTAGSDTHNRGHVPSAYSRGLRWLVEDVDEPDVGDLVWNCLWDKARGAKHAFTDDRQGQGLRMDLHHPFDDQFRRFIPHLSPRLALVQRMERTRMGERFRGEILIQNLREELEPGATVLFLRAIPLRVDRDLALGLVRVLSAYCRRHILEDLTHVFYSASRFLDSCPDTYTCDALRSCIILGTLNWIRSRIDVAMSPTFGRSTALVLTGIISKLQEAFGMQPDGLNGLPHVPELAVLVRSYCTFRGQRVTWPLAEDFDRSVLRSLSPTQGQSVVLHLLKLSVCDIGRDAEKQAHVSIPPPHGPSPSARTADSVPAPRVTRSPSDRVRKIDRLLSFAEQHRLDGPVPPPYSGEDAVGVAGLWDARPPRAILGSNAGSTAPLVLFSEPDPDSPEPAGGADGEERAPPGPEQLHQHSNGASLPVLPEDALLTSEPTERPGPPICALSVSAEIAPEVPSSALKPAQAHHSEPGALAAGRVGGGTPESREDDCTACHAGDGAVPPVAGVRTEDDCSARLEHQSAPVDAAPPAPSATPSVSAQSAPSMHGVVLDALSPDTDPTQDEGQSCAGVGDCGNESPSETNVRALMEDEYDLYAAPSLTPNRAATLDTPGSGRNAGGAAQAHAFDADAAAQNPNMRPNAHPPAAATAATVIVRGDACAVSYAGASTSIDARAERDGDDPPVPAVLPPPLIAEVSSVAPAPSAYAACPCDAEENGRSRVAPGDTTQQISKSLSNALEPVKDLVDGSPGLAPVEQSLLTDSTGSEARIA